MIVKFRILAGIIFTLVYGLFMQIPIGTLSFTGDLVTGLLMSAGFFLVLTITDIVLGSLTPAPKEMSWISAILYALVLWLVCAVSLQLATQSAPHALKVSFAGSFFSAILMFGVYMTAYTPYIADSK
jgi:nicotinamide riboside transporter PnuC